MAKAITAHKQRRESYWQKLKTDDSQSPRPDVGAIYFGDWAPDPWMEAVHGANWTEWQLPINAQPRYPGHHQPNLPLETKGWGPNHLPFDRQHSRRRCAEGLHELLCDVQSGVRRSRDVAVATTDGRLATPGADRNKRAAEVDLEGAEDDGVDSRRGEQQRSHWRCPARIA